MISYIIRRLLLLILVLFGVVTLVFSLIHFVPGDPVDLMLGDHAVAADKAVLRHDLGLDQPVFTQYGHYIKDVVRGDLGISIHSRRPVTEEITERFPATLELMIGSMIVALLIAVPLGIVAALKPYGIWDSLSMLVSLLGIALPHFWLGPMLILIFSIQLDWLPVNERGNLAHLMLPAITLGTGLAAILARMIRASLLEVLGEDYVRTARAKGVSSAQVVLRHAMPNALIPVVTIVGLQVGVLLSGAIITEAIFDWPGVGTFLLQGIYTRDYPVVQGGILVIATIYVLVNLLTDLAYAWIDPRVRLS